jgi:hypothetical protein
MRTVVEQPDLAASVGRKGQLDVQERHSVQKRSEFVRGRFDSIQKTRYAGTGRAVVGGATGGDPSGPVTLSAVGDLVRRAVRRARGQGLATQTKDLDRAVSELTSEVHGLQSVRNAESARQSDRDSGLEVAVREIGRRLGSLERRLDSLERAAWEMPADIKPGTLGDPPADGSTSGTE